MIFILSCLEYYPRHDFLIFLMWMLGIIAYIMRFAIGGAIETVALASGDFVRYRKLNGDFFAAMNIFLYLCPQI